MSLARLMAPLVAPLGAALLCCAGCVTEERILPTVVNERDGKAGRKWRVTRRVTHRDLDPDYGRASGAELKAATATNPNDARSWWRLGEFYERGERWVEAHEAYGQLLRCTVAIERRGGQRYLGPRYLFAKTAAALGDYETALANLRWILKLQPRSVNLALKETTFAEAHFLLGVIYFKHAQWALAEEHFETFVSLGGVALRAVPFLTRIRSELRPESIPAFVTPLAKRSEASLPRKTD